MKNIIIFSLAVLTITGCAGFDDPDLVRDQEGLAEPVANTAPIYETAPQQEVQARAYDRVDLTVQIPQDLIEEQAAICDLSYYRLDSQPGAIEACRFVYETTGRPAYLCRAEVLEVHLESGCPPAGGDCREQIESSLAVCSY